MTRWQLNLLQVAETENTLKHKEMKPLTPNNARNITFIGGGH